MGLLYGRVGRLTSKKRRFPARAGGERGWLRLVRGVNNLGVEADCDWAVWDGVVPGQ
jgi:hypothetical protein